MADLETSNLDAKTDVNGEELLMVVDLRESDESDQNKKMTTDTLFSSVLTYENEILIFEDDILYYG